MVILTLEGVKHNADNVLIGMFGFNSTRLLLMS
jgi:hypothetical protein